MGVGRPTFARAAFDQGARISAAGSRSSRSRSCRTRTASSSRPTDGWRAKVEPPAGTLPPELRRELARAPARRDDRDRASHRMRRRSGAGQERCAVGGRQGDQACRSSCASGARRRGGNRDARGRACGAATARRFPRRASPRSASSPTTRGRAGRARGRRAGGRDRAPCSTTSRAARTRR